ncbi:DFG10 [Zalerion maritima]|uniref:Polyprenal reductase n=1 Tax=Zalerion maritima TaxID=339359 RepID=A0AAD5RUE7_9PEZI|nr:DFG10 [Zalerion maritima]
MSFSKGGGAVSSLLDKYGPNTPAQGVQAFFIFIIVFVAFAAALPPDVSGLLLNYGSRSSQITGGADGDGTTSNGGTTGTSNETREGWLASFAAKLTSYGQVPHQWFVHFYMLSFACSLFWLHQHVSSGPALRGIAVHQTKHAGKAELSMTLGQVYLAWCMMLVQGSRRLYEDLYVKKQSKSPMWVVHWLLGLGFYSAMSVAVWIEGSGALLTPYPPTAAQLLDIPIIKMMVGGGLFIIGSRMQHQCHVHLASLKKYSLPTDVMFSKLVCPHYTAECLIYVGMAVAAAPPHAMLNKTVLCALIFVATNLGITAYGTRKWYAEKFGEDKLIGKWNMIPWVF